MSKIIANQIERIGGVAFTLPATDGTVDMYYKQMALVI